MSWWSQKVQPVLQKAEPFIPVVVAMSATQNVKAALSGGWVAILVGIIASLACYLLIPVMNKFSKNLANPKK